MPENRHGDLPKQDLEIIASIDHYLSVLAQTAQSPTEELFKKGDELYSEVKEALNSSPRFDFYYLGDLFHDLEMIWNISGMLGWEHPGIAELYAKVAGHVVGSIKQEIMPKMNTVDLAGLINEIKTLFDTNTSVFEKETRFLSSLSPGLTVLSQDDVLFRIIYNLTRNSEKSIKLRHGESGKGGLVNFGARRTSDFILLDIADNGVGFGGLLKKINFQTNNNNIPLSEILNQSRGVSWFQEVGAGGFGKGLRICQHLTDLIGAKICIRNPNLTEGSLVSIHLPSITK